MNRFLFPLHEVINHHNTRLTNLFLRCELLSLLIIAFAFWHHSPPIRDQWLPLLLLMIPIYCFRWIQHGRFWTYTSMDAFWSVFIVLSAVNFLLSPYPRANYWVVVSRPILGILIYLFCVEFARIRRNITGLLIVTILLGILVAILGLTATQWNEKSTTMQFIIDLLPRLDHRAFLPDMKLSLNSNEIAGALAWLCPVMAGFFIYSKSTTATRTLWQKRFFQIGCAAAFVASFAALFLGQSRFALAGVFIALLGIVLILVPTRRWRYGWLGIIAIFIILESLIVFRVLPISTLTNETASDEVSQSTLSPRDQTTFATRFEIWQSGLHMMLDYPLTGVGMSTFRSAVRHKPYIIQHYAERNDAPPHAHNEWVQIGADMGIPGLIIFIGWYLTAGFMIYQIKQRGTSEQYMLAISLAGGLLAHAIYGIGDAITLWDRFSFIFWLLLGLLGAIFILASSRYQKTNNDQ